MFLVLAAVIIAATSLSIIDPFPEFGMQHRSSRFVGLQFDDWIGHMPGEDFVAFVILPNSLNKSRGVICIVFSAELKTIHFAVLHCGMLNRVEALTA